MLIPYQAQRSNQTVLTTGRNRETGTSGNYGFSDYPEQSTLDIYIYWVADDSRDLQFWLEYLCTYLSPTKQYLQQAKFEKKCDKWVQFWPEYLMKHLGPIKKYSQ